jgi:DNA-binding NarL/FixJ family response regulator
MLNDERIVVLIAHANPLVTVGLEAAFSSQQDFRVVERCAPDEVSQLPLASIAVTDCENGTRLMASQQSRQYRVLILTDDESEVSIRRAVEMGTGGYLPLSSCVESVVNAVRCIHNGGTAIAPNVMTKMARSLRSLPLTEREIEVLRLLMRGLPDKAIARQLQRSTGTVKSHVKAILTKLEASNRVEAVAVARRRGLIPENAMVTPAA